MHGYYIWILSNRPVLHLGCWTCTGHTQDLLNDIHVIYVYDFTGVHIGFVWVSVCLSVTQTQMFIRNKLKTAPYTFHSWDLKHTSDSHASNDFITNYIKWSHIYLWNSSFPCLWLWICQSVKTTVSFKPLLLYCLSIYLDQISLQHFDHSLNTVLVITTHFKFYQGCNRQNTLEANPQNMKMIYRWVC